MISYSVINNYLKNIPGKNTNRKLVVFESDDWGSIRMPSVQSCQVLQDAGLDMLGGDSKRYNLYDTLASSDDLNALFNVLTQYKDQHGHHPVFTAVSVVANPDFDKIKACNYQQYFYEPFTKTLQRYYGSDTPYVLWRKGMDEGLFEPQFHGREHLNVQVWLRALQAGDKNTLLAFQHGLWGFNAVNQFNISYQAAFELELPEDIHYQETVIREGLQLFEEIHGYKATYFVPPNGPINNKLEKTAAEFGVQYVAASKIQMESLGNGQTAKKFHYIGQRNEHSQIYITRNCFFEPSQEGRNWVDSCLNEIKIAFFCKKPAVISTHRVNYIGSLDQKNRDVSLKQLETLLSEITRKWPEAEFITSSTLGSILA
jgi:hypothetical protein